MILRQCFVHYGLDYRDFAKQYHWSPSSIRYWFIGRCCPSLEGLSSIKKFLYISLAEESPFDDSFYAEIKKIFEAHGVEHIYRTLRDQYRSLNLFAGEVLETCYAYVKHKYEKIKSLESFIPPSGRTQAVVFDFDGTLTSSKANQTTWESIWISLGYDVKLCQELHMKFNRGDISHSEWCKLTEQFFKEKCLHKSSVERIASKMKLIAGARKTFKELYNRGIKTFIVSGSIMTVIRTVIRPIYLYIDGIKANEFRYGADGLLEEIIGTKYDFKGKPNYIREIADELHISPADILFVGNSANDQFAYLSGARTLCINPTLTDITDSSVWNYCIQTCNDLADILNYIL